MAVKHPTSKIEKFCIEKLFLNSFKISGFTLNDQ